MKRVLKAIPETSYILSTELTPTDIVVQVYDNDASILSRTETKREVSFGFFSIARRQEGRLLDWNTCSDSREEAIRRVTEVRCELFVFDSQTEFFEACIKNKWKFIH